MRNYFPVVAARRAASASLICAICVICGLSSALEISNSTNTPDTNSAAIYATLTNVTIATTATCYYGTTDGGTTATSWAYSTNYADPTNGPVSVTVTNLQPATWYYYRWYAADGGTNTNSTAWSATSSNLTTASRSPTNYPIPGAGVTVVAGTNGVLLSPTNFFNANGIPGSDTTAAIQGAILTNAGNIATNTGNIQTNAANIQTNAGNLNLLSNRVTNIEGWVLGATNIVLSNEFAWYPSTRTLTLDTNQLTGIPSNWFEYSQGDYIFRDLGTTVSNTGWLIPYSNAWGVGWTDQGTGYTNEGAPLMYAERDGVITSASTGQYITAYFTGDLGGTLQTSAVASCSIELPDEVIQGLEIQIDWGADDELSAATLTGYIYCVVGSVTSDVMTFTNALSPNWVSNVVGSATNYLGLSQDDFTGETNLDVYVYFIGTAEAMTIALDAISLRVYYGINEPTYGLTTDGRFRILEAEHSERFPVEDYFTLAGRLDLINAWPTDTWDTAATDASAATAAVAAAQGAITTNAGNITTNASAILALSNRMDAAEGAITTNSGNILTNTAAISNLFSPYQAFTTNLAPDDGGTCTITWACGPMIAIPQGTNLTLSFDQSSFSDYTNGVNRVGAEIFIDTNYSLAFDLTTIVSNATEPTLVHNDWNSFQFRRTSSNLWDWMQIKQ